MANNGIIYDECGGDVCAALNVGRQVRMSFHADSGTEGRLSGKERRFMRYCGYCGMPMEDDDLFCTRCGKRAGISSAEASAEAAAAAVDTEAVAAAVDAEAAADPLDASKAHEEAGGRHPASGSGSSPGRSGQGSPGGYMGRTRASEEDEGDEAPVHPLLARTPLIAAALAVAAAVFAFLIFGVFRPADPGNDAPGAGETLPVLSGDAPAEGGDDHLFDGSGFGDAPGGRGSEEGAGAVDPDGAAREAAAGDFDGDGSRLYGGQKQGDAEDSLSAEEEVEKAEGEGAEAEAPDQEAADEERKNREQEEASEDGQQKDDGYILPGSDARFLSRGEIEVLDDWTLQMAINELYARHGRIFESSDIRSYFLGKSWYREEVDPQTFSANEDRYFNEYEQANLNLLSRIRSEREGAAAPGNPPAQ